MTNINTSFFSKKLKVKSAGSLWSNEYAEVLISHCDYILRCLTALCVKCCLSNEISTSLQQQITNFEQDLAKTEERFFGILNTHHIPENMIDSFDQKVNLTTQRLNLLKAVNVSQSDLKKSIPENQLYSWDSIPIYGEITIYGEDFEQFMCEEMDSENKRIEKLRRDSHDPNLSEFDRFLARLFLDLEIKYQRSYLLDYQRTCLPQKLYDEIMTNKITDLDSLKLTRNKLFDAKIITENGLYITDQEEEREEVCTMKCP